MFLRLGSCFKLTPYGKIEKIGRILMAYAKNTRTGKVVSVPEHYIGHEVLGKDLEPLGGAEVQAAPKMEKKNKFAKFAKAEQSEQAEELTEQEQPAPEYKTESNEEIN